MAEPRFASDDDLPRTFRREREAREREAREREGFGGHGAHGGHPGGMAAGEFGPTSDYAPPSSPDPLYAAPGFAGTVTRFDVPFLHLVKFFLKAVLAAIPALILLGGLLFGAGTVMKQTLGWSQIEIKINPSNPGQPPAPGAQPAPPAAKLAPAKK